MAKFIFKASNVHEKNDIYGSNCMSYLTNHEAVNLDDLEDWKLAEKIIKTLNFDGKIKIGFTISNSWGVKNLLNSGVIPELKSSFYISIYTTKDLCGHIESQFPSAFDRLHLIIDEETSINKLIRKLKKFIFISINNLKTVKITTKRKTSFIFYMLFIAFFNIFRLFCSHSLLMMIDKIHSHFFKKTNPFVCT